MLGIAFFIIFIVWGFLYYSSLFPSSIEPVNIEYTAKKIFDFLWIDAYEVPVWYNASSNGEEVLYLDFFWPKGTKNSTQIFSDGISLECNLSDDRVYWIADVVPGENRFIMKFVKKDSEVLCNTNISSLNPNQTIPWTMEKKKVFSWERLNQMFSTNYTDFKTTLGIFQDFQILIINDTQISYGKTPPLFSNVYTSEKSGLTEDGKEIKTRILIW